MATPKSTTMVGSKTPKQSQKSQETTPSKDPGLIFLRVEEQDPIRRRSQSDSEGFELEIGESELDLEIPVDMRVIDDEIVAETRTLRDIKTELDAEDALINRLGVCSI